MSDALRQLNEQRKDGYKKPAVEEDFFLEMNKALQIREQTLYQKIDEIEHPFIFVFGAPRSGTTLLTQLISASLDVGYINNLAARFWLAPLHGLRLSRAVLESNPARRFESDYARTNSLTDIHEFGYFWRHWLRKENHSDVVHCRQREHLIDWEGLRTVLANLVNEFAGPMIFKNIFGSYHLQRFREILEKVIYIYIERDPLDTAVSILEARRKHYTDLNSWWSYTPLEYDELKDMDYWEQIAGQVYYLQRYYREQSERVHPDYSLVVNYQALCESPAQIIRQIQQLSSGCYNYLIKPRAAIPANFPFRQYTDRDQEKARFQQAIEQFARQSETK